MLNATMTADLRAAFRTGGFGAAAELARARGLEVPAGAELTDLELELIAGGKKKKGGGEEASECGGCGGGGAAMGAGGGRGGRRR